APHHTISVSGLIDGGSPPRPGEVTLAHRGVLFLDELPEFQQHVLESLRQPLEDGRVTIARASGIGDFPARFQLVGAANPCRRGCSSLDLCVCTPAERARYLGRLSRPLLDRIDLHVELPALGHRDLAGAAGDGSAVIRQRVQAARERPRSRVRRLAIRVNAELSARHIRRFCPVPHDAERMLAAAMSQLGLSARGHDRVLKVARTIADLDGAEGITAEHCAEALQYRGLDAAGARRSALGLPPSAGRERMNLARVWRRRWPDGRSRSLEASASMTRYFDLRSTVLIVVGHGILPEEEDRPIAYDLKRAINARAGGSESRAGVVVTDIWVMNTELGEFFPAIALGGPTVNAFTAQV